MFMLTLIMHYGQQVAVAVDKVVLLPNGRKKKKHWMACLFEDIVLKNILYISEQIEMLDGC